nr:NAD(P)-dependent oxidoreductase [Pseudomonas sp. P1.8]
MGIVGLGRIGRAVAARAQAFGMSIAYTGRATSLSVACICSSVRKMPKP